jgi:hypothetical protein
LLEQVSDLLAQRLDMIYGAIFDEADEGATLFSAETREDKLPVGSNMLCLSQDGGALLDDWYLGVARKVAELLKLRRLPPGDLSEVLKP